MSEMCLKFINISLFQKDELLFSRILEGHHQAVSGAFSEVAIAALHPDPIRCREVLRKVLARVHSLMAVWVRHQETDHRHDEDGAREFLGGLL